MLDAPRAKDAAVLVVQPQPLFVPARARDLVEVRPVRLPEPSLALRGLADLVLRLRDDVEVQVGLIPRDVLFAMLVRRQFESGKEFGDGVLDSDAGESGEVVGDGFSGGTHLLDPEFARSRRSLSFICCTRRSPDRLVAAAREIEDGIEVG